MWSFRKKKMETLELPPMPKKDDITLLPEETIPTELPSLETEIKQKEAVQEVVPKEELVVGKAVRFEKATKTELVEKFLRLERHKGVISEINNLTLDFNNLDFEISRVIQVKGNRDDKLDDLQSSLEDVSKRLITVENTLFGG